MNYFKNESPFVQAAFDVAIAPGRIRRALPVENIVQRPAQQRFFIGDVAHKRDRVGEIFALLGVTGVTRTGCASDFSNAIAVGGRRELDVIMKFEGLAHVGTRGAVVAKMGLD